MLTIENDLEPVWDSDGPQSCVDEWEGSIRIYLPKRTWSYYKQALEILDDCPTPYDDEGIDVLDYEITIHNDPDSIVGVVMEAVPCHWEGCLPYNIAHESYIEGKIDDAQEKRMEGKSNA